MVSTMDGVPSPSAPVMRPRAGRPLANVGLRVRRSVAALLQRAVLLLELTNLRLKLCYVRMGATQLASR